MWMNSTAVRLSQRSSCAVWFHLHPPLGGQGWWGTEGAREPPTQSILDTWVMDTFSTLIGLAVAGAISSVSSH